MVLPFVPVTPTTVERRRTDDPSSVAASRPHREPHVVDDHDLRHIDGRATRSTSSGDRAALDRRGGEVVTVGDQPAHAAEQRARSRPTRES